MLSVFQTFSTPFVLDRKTKIEVDVHFEKNSDWYFVNYDRFDSIAVPSNETINALFVSNIFTFTNGPIDQL